MKIVISRGNMKLGKIASVSTPPIKGCIPNVPCTRECYAMKAYRLRPNVQKAWNGNLEFINADINGFFNAIADDLENKPQRFFRWFTGGDIPSQDFLDRMNNLAGNFASTRFLSFTKNHSLNFVGLHSNLVVIASMWPNWGIPDVPLQKAWMQDGTESRVPSNALECYGACDKCGMCWHLPDLKKDVVFHKH